GPAAATAVYSAASLADVAVQANYVLAHANDSVSLLARYSGTGTQRNYYAAQLVLTTQPNGQVVVTAKLLRVQAGRPGTLVTATPPASGLLRLEVQGSMLQLLVNGIPLIAGKRDTALSLPGLVGISASANVALTNFAVAAP